MNGSTIGEFLGWRLANQLCSLQLMAEQDPDFDPDSAHVQRMLRFADNLTTVLWPEVHLDLGDDLPPAYGQALARLHGPGEPMQRPAGESLREGVVLWRAERSLLREPPPGLGNAANLPYVAHRLQILLADGELPTAALACHIEGGGREASDGLRTPLKAEQWTLREYVARTYYTLANNLRRPGRDQFLARIDAGEAAASLLLYAWQRRPDAEAVRHQQSPADISLACLRLAEGLGPRDETAAALAPPIERLRVYAGIDGWPLADVLELPAVGRQPVRESDSDFNDRARLREWDEELTQATKIKIDRGTPFSMKIGPRVTSPDYRDYPPPKRGW